MMMNSGPQRQYIRQKDYRYCQHHAGVPPSQQLGPAPPQLVYPMIVNPEVSFVAHCIYAY